MRLPLTFHETIFTFMLSCSTNFGRYFWSWRVTQSWLFVSLEEAVEEEDEGAGEGGDWWSWCWDTAVSAITVAGAVGEDRVIW
jgi:hypothetical protein